MKEVKTVGIIGFGVMGAAIGLNAATNGYKVVFKELNDELVKSMYDKFVLKALAKRVSLGKMAQADMDKICGMISGTTNFKDMAVCDLIIEAAIEKMDLKIQIFGELLQGGAQGHHYREQYIDLSYRKAHGKGGQPGTDRRPSLFFPGQHQPSG